MCIYIYVFKCIYIYISIYVFKYIHIHIKYTPHIQTLLGVGRPPSPARTPQRCGAESDPSLAPNCAAQSCGLAALRDPKNASNIREFN